VDDDGTAIFASLRFNGWYEIVQTRTRSATGTLTDVQDVS
jgi:hypothetical protein